MQPGQTQDNRGQEGHRITLCVKTPSHQENHDFNVNDKIKDIVSFAVRTKEFGLPPKSDRPYEAFLELPDGKRKPLDLSHTIADEHIAPLSCIIIATPVNVDG